MNRSVWLWQLMGFGVSSFLGTILHFLYDWTGKCPWIAPFSGVNESTWEHMKLLFWPMVLYAAIEGMFFRDRLDFSLIKLRGTLLGLILIPLLFYTYNGVIGKSPDWVNISIFFVCAAAAYFYETILFYKGGGTHIKGSSAVIVFLLLAILFVLFTFYPPRIGVFKDPLTGSYGV